MCSIHSVIGYTYQNTAVCSVLHHTWFTNPESVRASHLTVLFSAMYNGVCRLTRQAVFNYFIHCILQHNFEKCEKY